MEKKLKVSEIYECLALLSGFNNQESKVKCIGFCNELGISEGMRRIANKTLKKINENWPVEQIKGIQALTKDILPSIEEGSDEETSLLTLKEEKLKELMSSEVTIIFEELPDFKLLDKRLEDTKESLSFVYTYIYERLFLNY